MSEGDGRWTDYAGGYSDMLAQRGTGVERKTVERPPRLRPDAAPTPARTARRRLSFKEKHALETLPAKIEALAAEAAKLQARLADPGLFGRDPGAFNEAGRKLADIEARKMAAEEEWLTLALLREEIEG
jgi:ABC transport system ATP-binding/permease protein